MYIALTLFFVIYFVVLIVVNLKKICSIFIDYTDGQHIPKPCDCTNDGKKKNNDNNNDNNNDDKIQRLQLKNMYHDPNLLWHGKPITKPWMQAPVQYLGHRRSSYSHGVQTHGTSYVRNSTGSFTKYQQQHMMALRRIDIILYNISRHVFDTQIVSMENRYNITICNNWFTL